MLKIRSVIRNLILELLSIFYFKIKPGIYILNGHYISPDNIKSNIQFEKLLDDLSKHYTLINIEVAVEMINSSNDNIDKPYMAFTFDDGFEECYTKIAPVLDKFKINCAFFIVPNFVDGNAEYVKNINFNYLNSSELKHSMSWKQIIDLSKRNYKIGSHTMNHKRLTTLNESELEYELINSKNVIETITKTNCDYFAYPYGKLKDINMNSIDIASKTYKYCFTQDNFTNYYSFDKKFINRRHFEPFWKLKHVIFFSRNRK